jgi:hypothetical protein
VTETATHGSWNMRQIVGRVLGFAAVSGAGLALDFGLFLSLVEFQQRPGLANLLSATAAVAFVYFVSVKRIFAYQGRFLLGLFFIYLAYQAVAVAAASGAVDWLVAVHAVAPAIAKVLILPLTFSANFLFMSWLTRRGPHHGL